MYLFASFGKTISNLGKWLDRRGLEQNELAKEATVSGNTVWHVKRHYSTLNNKNTE